MVENRHRELAAATKREDLARRDGTSTANGAMRTLKILYNFSAERCADMPPNPVKRLRRQWYPEPRRRGKVRPEQMPAFYAAVQALENHVSRDYILFLLFTGMRRTEAATLKWDDVDLPKKVIRLPDMSTKTGQKFDLPMSDVVGDLLVARRALGNAGGFVFPGAGRTGHISDPGLGHVTAACGVKVSPHDLRRTFESTAESLDLSVYALKALINHSTPTDVTGRYIVHEIERLRQAAQRVADEIKAMAAIQPVAAPNVERLRG
jgi:integrase